MKRKKSDAPVANKSHSTVVKITLTPIREGLVQGTHAASL